MASFLQNKKRVLWTPGIPIKFVAAEAGFFASPFPFVAVIVSGDWWCGESCDWGGFVRLLELSSRL